MPSRARRSTGSCARRRRPTSEARLFPTGTALSVVVQCECAPLCGDEPVHNNAQTQSLLNLYSKTYPQKCEWSISDLAHLITCACLLRIEQIDGRILKPQEGSSLSFFL